MLIVLADLAYGAELGVLCNRELDGLRAEFGREERKSGQALGATPGRTLGVSTSQDSFVAFVESASTGSCRRSAARPGPVVAAGSAGAGRVPAADL
jgi:hypothetical protein